MKLFIAKETHPGETRTPVIPPIVQKWVKLGATVAVETGLGESLGLNDDAYQAAGAEMCGLAEGLADADIVLRLRKPPLETVGAMKPGALHISYLDPFNEHALIRELAVKHISAVSLEMIPRTTIAQKMDVISSQANLGGYVAVILAAERLAKIFPMMTTPAGTIAPAKVFVIGVGVAGLQAIATAKRLGALVEAFDTRPVVEDQVKSLGAKFVKVDLGETGQTKDGYAKALTPEQLELQRKAMAKHCAGADVVITTAQVFGRKAPVIVTRDMVAGMAPGSVIVDMAVETGGNVEGSVVNDEVLVNGVRLIGLGNLPGRVAVHASQMYASNLYNFVEHFWDKKESRFVLKHEDEIIKGCLVTHGGEVVNPTIKALLDAGKEG
ncbi:MAG TPA: NAD(P) transhydrogenase subunit alpha [Kiritimatiellia bacterium]|nr:NAD(P) transhydrogenase subunit alpha [Kiritimatiellia bacterium]HMP00231.1 NAD(P) transhydrogenase subunit alpha [Kiritimatiellia bacterium]HMP97184.1 NAD(P) transhydrogenase subunit alpha [Kiritimatiellia bacterium]